MTHDSYRELLPRALQRTLSMDHEDAVEIATRVLQAFGDNAEVSDETIDTHVRSVFYTLEGKKILSFRRVEYATESGEKRRAFYWRIREDTLTAPATPVQETPEDVYTSLPKDAWER